MSHLRDHPHIFLTFFSQIDDERCVRLSQVGRRTLLAAQTKFVRDILGRRIPTCLRSKVRCVWRMPLCFFAL
jgi:hypothetical protein